jgi:tRNA(Arg) A34 adenosine deaminase TadA
MTTRLHRSFLLEASNESLKVESNDKIGAVVVLNNTIIGRGHNKTIELNDASAHAEILAMRGASDKLKSKYLYNCVLYSTHEPCCMCIGMVGWSHIKEVFYIKPSSDPAAFNYSGKLARAHDIINLYDWDIKISRMED